MPVVVLALALGASGLAGCGGRQAAPNAAAPMRGTPAVPLPNAPQGAQDLSLQVIDGRFPIAQYEVHTGPVRLIVTVRGGPYTLKIEPLLEPHKLPASATTTVSFEASTPGQYTMELTGDTTRETAVLTVRAAAQSTPAAVQSTPAAAPSSTVGR